MSDQDATHDTTAAALPPVPTQDRIRVLLADDQLLLRQSFQRLIELEDPGVEVVGMAADGQEAVEQVERLAHAGRPPHVILMDVRMPRMDGLEATRRIRIAHPEVRVVILTTFDDADYALKGVQAGLNGYLLKDVSATELVAAIRAAHRGESPLQPSVAAKLLARMAQQSPQAPLGTSASVAGVTPTTTATTPVVSATPASPYAPTQRAGPQADDLTEREREIVGYIARGANNREIGEALFITEGTVKNHVSNILNKLALRDRTQAALWAREQGLG